MQIQPAFNAGPAQNTQGVVLSNGAGGNGSTTGDGMRADWNVRMNVSHETGFVGGAGRLLIHNTSPEELTEINLLLPAAQPSFMHGRLEMASASVCSAKPGMPAQAGQTLAFRSEGPLAIITVPMMRHNDWLYIDVTWTGSFPKEGAAFEGGKIPLGQFHPQLAVVKKVDNGLREITGIASRYDAEVGSDAGAKVVLESEELGKVVERPSEDGAMTMHEFKSFGAASILASLAPPGAITGPAFPDAMQQPMGITPTLGDNAPTFMR